MHSISISLGRFYCLCNDAGNSINSRGVMCNSGEQKHVFISREFCVLCVFLHCEIQGRRESVFYSIAVKALVLL